MQTDNSNKKYDNCSMEDLLQDDFFISSMINPTKETNDFWTDILEKEIVDKHNYMLARYFIDSVQVQTENISQKEIFSLWENIEVENKTNLKKRGKRFNIYFSMISGIAAMLVVVFLYFLSTDMLPEEVVTLSIEDVKAPDVTITDIQLVLADNETVSLEGKEADIIYNEEGIAINNRNTGLKNKQQYVDASMVYNQLIVPKGKRSMLTFADGSKIWVNAGSRVVYPIVFDKKKREIYVDGEAFLEVSRNEKSPFVVKIKKLDVEVLGTSFNVMAYEKDTIQNIVLVNGSVKVNAGKSKETILEPNEMFSLINDMAEVKTVNVEDHILWKTGIYQYQSEPLGVILQRLSRYYGEEINCAPKASQLMCSGKLDLKDDLFAVLKGIAQTAPIYCKNEKGIYFVTNK